MIKQRIASAKELKSTLSNWYKQELKSLHIDIHMQEEVCEDFVTSTAFDKVIIATDSKPIKFNLPGSEDATIYTTVEMLHNPQLAGSNIAIIGAGLVGAELGLWLQQLGKKVTLVEMSNEILGGEDALCFANYDMLKDLLKYHGVTILKNTKAKVVDRNGLRIEQRGKESLLAADTIVEAVGYTSFAPMYENLKYSDVPIQCLGDAAHVHNITDAIWSAYEVA